MKKLLCFAFAIFSFITFTNASAEINIVAAENVYGTIAQEIGGDKVHVITILNSPNQDPHLFSASSLVAKEIADADIVIVNGANYDSWLPKLISANHNSRFSTINVANLVCVKAGSNPHLWYQPEYMETFVVKFTEELTKKDPTHAAFYQQNKKKFSQKNRLLLDKIHRDKQRWQGTQVIATEPVMGYLADLLGLEMHGSKFQLSIMNDTEPSPIMRAEFEKDLKLRQVKLLIFNQQVSDPITQQMRKLAEINDVPVIGVNELLPANTRYHQWLQDVLYKLEAILDKK